MNEFSPTNPKEAPKQSILENIRRNKLKTSIAALAAALLIFWAIKSCNTPKSKEENELELKIENRSYYNKEIDASTPITINRNPDNSLLINQETINLRTNMKWDESQLFIYTDTTKNKNIPNINNINIEDVDWIPSESKIIYSKDWSTIQVVKNQDWKGKVIRTIETRWQPYLWIIIVDKIGKSHIIIIWKLINKIDERKINLEEKLKNLKNSSNKIIDLSLWNKVNIVSAKLAINWNNIKINYPYHLTPTSIPYLWKWVLTVYINNNQNIEPYSFYIDIPESREENLDNNPEQEFWNNILEDNNNQNWIQQIIKNIERINKLWVHHQTLNEYNQLISDIKLISTTYNNEDNKAQWQLIATAHLNSRNIYSHLEKSHKNNPNNIYLITNSTWENLNTQTLNDLIKCSTLNNVILFLNFTNIEQISKLSEIQTSNINKSRIFITIPDDLIKDWNWENDENKIPEWFFDWNFGLPIFWWNSFSDTHTWYTVIEINPYKYHDKLWENDTIDPQ